MPLPDALTPFFWDCDFRALDGQRDADFVISRILASGTWDAIRWLRREYGDTQIRECIMQHRGRGLSSEQLRLWELLVGLPADAVNEWLSSVERRTWEEAGVPDAY
jgi:hypothetical protein